MDEIGDEPFNQARARQERGRGARRQQLCAQEEGGRSRSLRLLRGQWRRGRVLTTRPFAHLSSLALNAGDHLRTGTVTAGCRERRLIFRPMVQEFYLNDRAARKPEKQ